MKSEYKYVIGHVDPGFYHKTYKPEMYICGGEQTFRQVYRNLTGIDVSNCPEFMQGPCTDGWVVLDPRGIKPTESNYMVIREVDDPENENARIYVFEEASTPLVPLSSLSSYLRSLVFQAWKTDEIITVKKDDVPLKRAMEQNPKFMDEIRAEVSRFGLDDIIEFDDCDHSITITCSIISTIAMFE